MLREPRVPAAPARGSRKEESDLKAKTRMDTIEPNRFRARCAAACLLALALLLAAGAAEAQTPIKLVDNTGQSSNTTTSLGSDFAQAFTTGSHPLGYRLTGVDIEFSVITTQPGYRVSIHPDFDGSPPRFLGSTLTNPASLVQGVNSFTAPGAGIYLAADTTYWVVLDVSSQGDADIQLTASDSETGESGWSIADLLHSREYQSTGSWTGSTSGHALKIDVRGHEIPDRTPPVFSRALVNGTALTVTFNEALDGGSAPAGSAFSVSTTRPGSPNRTITGTGTVSLSGMTATVTLGDKVVIGETVTVRYDKPGTNPLRDAAANEVASFSDKAAANETPAPVFSGASVNGTTLTVTFDETLDGGSAPAGSAFSVSATPPGGTARKFKGTGKVTVSGMTATVTLAEAIVHGETVTASYVKPGANPLQDAAANEALNFTDRPVTNDTPDTAPPAVTDATVYENTLTVTFDEALDGGSAPAGSAFSVSATPPDGAARNIKGTGTATVSGMTATVTLAEAIVHGETVTASYAKPGANPLRDAAENEAAGFSGQTAANDTPAESDTTPPVLWRATVQGSVIVLIYSETLDPGHTPPPAQYHVTVPNPDPGMPRLERQVTDVEIRGGSVVLTLESAVAEGQDVRLTYEAPVDTDSGDVGIQDYAGNRAGRIGNRRLAGDTRYPRLRAATVEGAVLTLTYDEELDPNATPPTGSFRVERVFTAKGGDLDDEFIGVTGVRIRGRAVILTLAKAVTGDDKVVVNYIITSDHFRIQDYAGNRAALIGYLEVTHGPPPTTRTPPPVGGGGGVRRPDTAPSFGDAAVAALTLREGAAMEPAALPEAAGGDGELTYSLTSEPAGLAGLVFDPATRTLSGTPSSGGDYVFTYRVHDADANRADSDAAVLRFNVTIERPLDRAALAVRRVLKRTLAAVGARTLAGALTGVGARFADAAPQSGVRLAGREVLLDASGAAAGFERAACLTEGYERGGCVSPRAVSREEFLRASAFNWTPASAGGGEAAGGSPLWAVWGRGDFGSFEGRPEAGSRYEGDTRTGWLGFDMRSGPWMAGVALAHGRSEADYDAGAEGASRSGRLETTLTALYPYGRWRFANGLELRAVVGAGSGEARHYPEGDSEETGDLEMRMASVGLRRPLFTTGGFDLAVRADASAVRLEMDNERPETTISGVSADGRRLRLGLEASRRVSLDGGASLTPFLEAAARHDSGDGITGSGVELAGGARYEASRLRVEIRGRWLAAHSEEGASEHGVSVTVRMGPGAGGQGLWFALAPRWGAPAGGAEALWRDEMPRLRGDADEGALDARVGYGFKLARGGLLTPFAETGAGGGSSRVRLGTRFKASRADLAMELAGEWRENEGAEPVHGVRLDVRLGF